MNTILKKEILKPKNKSELVNFIKDEIKEHDHECNLNHIDTSSIDDMSFLFSSMYGLNKFNGDISSWDTSNVTNMEGMFNLSIFNQDISLWNTSNVTNMNSMFSRSIFNQNISNWNTFNVRDMSSMFQQSQFNQNISSWNISNVSEIFSMFFNSKFNQDISQWDISKVTNMSYMFYKSSITKIPQWNYFKINNIKKCFDDCLELIETLPDWYQFNHIKNSKDRKKTYDDYLKKNKINNSIYDNLNVNSKKQVNKI